MLMDHKLWVTAHVPEAEHVAVAGAMVEEVASRQHTAQHRLEHLTLAHLKEVSGP